MPIVVAPKMKQILTATELAKLRKVSISYICRLCRLPPDHPLHIKSVKINRQMRWITDDKILREFEGKYCSDA